MAPVATTTNSYITQVDAAVYFDERLHTDTWDDASADDQERSLIHATRILDTYVEWFETPDKTLDIDQAIKNATCELALVQLSGDTQKVDDMNGIKSLKVAGAVEIEKESGSRTSIIAAHIWAMISHLGSSKITTGSIEIVRS
jgi:hypothetical protein